MTTRTLSTFLRHLRRATGAGSYSGAGDARLLERFAACGDEAAFAALVGRHGPLVWQVCRRVLRHEHDAEDAFQAAFLALARKARSIGRGEAVGGWLYRVALRVALRVRAAAARRVAHERPAADADRAAAGRDDPLWRDLRPVLDEEVARLPGRYRAAFVLCCLEGKTNGEAARQLGCAPGTVGSRLAWARLRLRTRLRRRGVDLSAGTLAVALAASTAPAAVPAPLADAVVRSAAAWAAGRAGSLVTASRAAALAEGVVRTMRWNRLKVVAAAAFAACVVGGGMVSRGGPRAAPADSGPAAERVPGELRAVWVPPETVERLGVRTVAARTRGAPPRELRLSGVLAFGPERLVRIRACVSGEVTELARGSGAGRPLTTGDRVEKGQLLAVVWSSDRARTKSDLAEALIKLWQDEETLKRYEELFKAGDLPEATLRAKRDMVAADRSTVRAARRMLTVSRVPDEEIEQVERETRLLFDRRDEAKEPDAERGAKEREWAKVEVRAPAGGTLVEKNVTVGDIVDTATDLFKVADLSELNVLAEVDEEDLRLLQGLPTPIPWQVRLPDSRDGKPLTSPGIEKLAAVVDPERHTATVTGRVANLDGRLRAGQFVTATVTFPPPAGPRGGAGNETAVPESALVEQDGDTFVLVRPDPGRPVFAARRVVVVRRGGGVAHVRARLTAEQERKGFQPVRPGEHVVTAGALDLQALLDDLKARGEPGAPTPP
jgi:RNA polymerase sigma factor (sigma-70 family)